MCDGSSGPLRLHNTPASMLFCLWRDEDEQGEAESQELKRTAQQEEKGPGLTLLLEAELFNDGENPLETIT